MNDDPDKPVFGRRPPSDRVSAPSRMESLEADYSEDAIPVGYEDDAVLAGRAPRRSRKARSNMVRFFNFVLTMVFIGVLLFAGAIWYGKSRFEAPGPLAEATTYLVEPGATFSSIVPDLEAKNIIPEQRPINIFLYGVKAAGKSSALKAGEFGFEPGMSMEQVMLELTEGRPIERALTFPEGWTSYQILERIAFAEHLEGDIPSVPEEGSLLPDTYTFPRGTERSRVIDVMQQKQKEALDRIWANRAENLPIETPEELVILASIVEKETGVASERPHVASVFINRLRKGQRLQTDPTIIYGIWGGKGKPKDRGGLRRSEIDRKTPYNTYQIDGLPPGPIANPGIASMEAVANPLETDDYYFVADGTGGHIFAKTLKEHNANVAKWRKIEAERREAEEAAASAPEGENTADNLDNGN